MEPVTKYNVDELRAALKSSRHPRYFMDHYDVSRLLGKNPGNHLPDDGFELVHNGVTIKCEPIVRVPGKKSSKHRVFYYCACCKFIPLGRAHQHLPHCEARDNTV